MKKFTVKPLVIELRPSKLIKGEIGLFAVRNLKKDAIIAQADKMGENFVPWNDFFKSDKITQKKIRQFSLETKNGLFVPDDINFLSVPWYMNHSCTYNIGFDKKGNFVTVRNIKKGEELFIDYGLGVSNPYFKLLCKCKSKNCRKIITGNDWLNDSFVEKNKSYFLRELLAARKKGDKK